MNSALTPREIQTRVRSGESLEQVAQAAGVPIEKIEPFAGPILAEREHVASTALTSPVRRTGESGNHRTLRQVVQERLLSRGLDIDDVEWDAWRVADRKWVVVATYQSGSATRVAHFRYDQLGRFSLAENDDARWLLGESGPSHGPQPNRRRRGDDPDAEPTIDFTDEFALVRAVGVQAAEDPRDALAQPFELGEETELAQVDGVYDIVPKVSQLDVLYDMFHSMNEDSVEIYPGLSQVRPVGQPTPVQPDLDDEAEPVPAHEPAPHADEPQGEVPALEGEVLVVDPETQAQADAYDPEPAVEPETPTPLTRSGDAAPRLSRRQRRQQRHAAKQPLELEQPPLVDEDVDIVEVSPDDVEAGDLDVPEPVQSPVPEPGPAGVAEPVDASPTPVAVEEPVDAAPTPVAVEEPVDAAAASVTDRVPTPVAEPINASHAPVAEAVPAPVAEPADAAPAHDADASPVDPSAQDAADAGDVVTEMESEPQTPPPAAEEKDPEEEETIIVPRTRSRRKRASVPSWDEIMFGSPRRPDAD